MDIKKRLPHEVCYDAADEILRQCAEIERLRAALKKIAYDDYNQQDHFDTHIPMMIWQAVARKALGVNEQITK